MKDIRDMRRSDWHRILERRYTVRPCSFQDMEGVVSLLEIQKVTNPLTVHYESGDVLIADAGYFWLQLAFKDRFFWATMMFDAKGEFMQGYFDITGGNTFEDMENPKFQDMYLDLVLTNDGGIQVLDQDELDEALEQKEITEEQYQQTVREGEKLYAFLQENKEEFVKFCTEWRERLLMEAENGMNMKIREAADKDLQAILELYLYLHEDSIPAYSEQLRSAWQQIMEDRNHHLIVCEVEGKIVSSCVCVIIPNLTRNVRPYAFVENVVTHGEYRGKGYATACLDYARKMAEENNCYKMMLLTGSKNPKTLNFYENAGYNSADKTAFIQWLDIT